MDKPDQDKDLFELYPELQVKLDEFRMLARKAGLIGKFEFS